MPSFSTTRRSGGPATWLVPALAACFLSLFASIASAGDAWHLDYIGILAQERLDPIVSPNGLAQHMHRIVGGSGFSAAYEYDRQVSSSCTTMGIKADKSNYWHPQLYWFDNATSTGATQFVPITGTVRWYYFLNRIAPDVPILPFPKGFRMLAGSPYNKDTGVSSFYSRFTCQQYQSLTNGLDRPDFNFEAACPWGLRTEVFMPSCWDGVNLYSADGSHVVYPIGSPTAGNCPASNPYRVPAIMLEYTWYPDRWAPGQNVAGHLAWANGDTTGAGIHADFTNGWDIDVLKQALDAPGCVNLTDAIPAQNCPVFGANFDINAASNGCTPSTGIVQEPFGNADMVPIPSLPGCNPLWGATGPKPTTCTTAAQTAKLNVTSQQGTMSNMSLPASQQLPGASIPTAKGWSYYQCLQDQSSTPAFLNSTSFIYSQMTVDQCLNTCAKSGYSWAALDYAAGWKCTCSSDLNTNALAAYSSCNTPCPGNSSQICGGSYAFAAYHTNAEAVPIVNSDSKNLTLSQAYLGCSASSILPNLATYTFSTNTVTNELCAQTCVNHNASWAATTSYNDCLCGDSFEFGTGTFRPDGYCNTACTGNSSEMCGGVNYYSVYNVAATELQAQAHDYPAGRVGCFHDYGRNLLSGFFTRNTTGMTVESCQGYCSELNFTYAGVEQGTDCFCGNSYDKTQTNLPASQCSTACAGNNKETCGATQVLEIYNAGVGPVTAASVAATHPSGWLGCYSNSPAQNGNYSYQSYNAMTVEMCKQTCSQFSYKYGMLTVGTKCSCTNTIPPNTQVPSAQYCTRACAANATESCGGNTAYDLYELPTAYNASSSRGAGWVGCYSNSAYNMTGLSVSTNSMTVEFCQSSCREMGYTYAGAAAGSQCYCTNTAPSNSGVLPVSGCGTPCVGNSTEVCGGSGQVSVYTAAQGVLPASHPAGWVGCYSDPGASTLLTSYSYSSSFMTASLCRSTCANQKYTYAGTEAGNTCRCGNSISGGTAYPTGMCSAPCAGSASESCGGTASLSVYTTANATSSTPVNSNSTTTMGTDTLGLLGCYSDSTNFKAFAYTGNIMSPAICARACSARSYTYSGVMNGNYCGCSNTAPVAQLPMSACSANCTASTGTCGGPNNVIQTYTVSKTAASGLLPAVGAKGFYGCFGDSSPRLLAAYSWNSNSMTPLLCAQQCNNFGYSISGVEFGTQCYCSSNLTISSYSVQYLDSDCGMACGGDSTQQCGSGGRIALYKTSDVPNLVDSSAPMPGKNNYIGCYGKGSVSGASYGISMAGMTNTLCRRICGNRNYPVSAVQANSCWCSATTASVFGGQVPQSQCTTDCATDTSEVCGGTAALSIWNTAGVTYSAPQFAAGYVGCYKDGSPRILSGFQVQTSSNSGAACQTICKSKGFALAGTEGGLCFCGNSVGTAIQGPDSTCSVPCGGNKTEMCGGSNYLSLYNVAAAASSGQATPQIAVASNATASASSASTVQATSRVNATSSATSTTARSASGTSAITSSASSKVTSASSSVTSSVVTSPSSLSKASSTVASTSSKAATTSASSSVAAASSSASSSRASSASSSSTRTSSVTATTTGSVSRNANLIATSSSTSVSGATSAASSSSTPSATSSTVKVASSSATASTRTTAASSSSAVSSSSTVRSSSSSSSASSSSAAAATPTPSAKSALLSSDGLVGCFTYTSTDVTMSQSEMKCDTLTPGMCKVLCNANGYKFAAVRNGNTCSCGTSTSTLTPASSGSCSAQCTGDSSLSCGGSSAYAVYNAQTTTTAKRDVEEAQVPVTPAFPPRSRSYQSNFKQVRRRRMAA